MNEAEKKLREAWAGASDKARGYVCGWADAKSGVHELGSAVRAFCESAPDNTAAEPEALRRVREAWGKCSEIQRSALTTYLRDNKQLHRNSVALDHALADLLESAPVEGGEYAAHLECALGDAKAAMAEMEAMRAKLAAAEREAEAMRDLATRNANALNAAVKERDEAQRSLAVARDAARDARHERDEAKHEARSARLFAVQNANARAAERELNLMRRSYETQISDLTRALDAEKKAHSEALAAQSRPEREVDLALRGALDKWFTCGRSKDAEALSRLASTASRWLAAPLSAPDEYTRAAVKFAELWVGNWGCAEYLPARDAWKAIYDARQRGEPSAPVSSPPPARVLECWFGEYDDGEVTVGFGCAKDAMRSNGVLRAHKLALPVIETVERGA